MYSPNPSIIEGQSLELYRLAELTLDHPSRKLDQPDPVKRFPVFALPLEGDEVSQNSIQVPL